MALASYDIMMNSILLVYDGFSIKKKYMMVLTMS